MSINNKLFKRITAIMLMLVTVLVTAGANVYTAIAGHDMKVGSRIFAEPGIDVFGDGRSSTFTPLFADGNIAYCVEYATHINDFASYVPTETPDVALGPKQKKQIAYALAYGYVPVSHSLNSSTGRAMYVMTQTLIWCITEGYWGNTVMMNRARDMMAPSIHNVYSDVSIRYSQEYFNKLRSDITLALDRKIPNGFALLKDEAPTIVLDWNSTNRR